jgi:hypothetical protein
MLSKYIHFRVFFFSFLFGLLGIYLLGPDTKHIYVYPTPETYMNNLYKDKTNQCFQFKPVITTCPILPLGIKTVPVQL